MKSKEQSINEALERELLPIKALERVEDVCIHVVDSTGKIVCYSKGCEKIENMKHEDVIGKNTAELYDYVENESMQDYVLKTGKKVRDIHVKYKLQMDLKNKQLRDNGTQFTFKDVVGSSIVTVESVRQGKIAAQTSAPILIAGPTGTGKEVFAQSIHNDSNRANYPFVAINCSAIPENLLESTLFGTVKGSFTGALDSKGLLESAKGGTLFFDEINSMNMTLQSKLLRVLETKRFRKVGGNKEIDMDVRILSALNQDPLKAIDEKRLRSDLYYRLAVFSINLPSLMERKSDIPELVSSFLSSEAVPMGKSLFSLSDNARDILLSHDWPGNIRELKHAITHAIYMAQYQDTILTSELLPAYLKKNLIEKKLTDKYLSSTETNQNLKSTLGYIEKQILCDVLNTNDYNISKSARELGISRQNLQYKIKLYHIECNT
ncbi:MAG: sigma 54-interacting transcriptional regulator [Eubacterium sp.]